MKLTVVTILVVVIFMCLIQIFFRDSFSVLNQEKFRRDNINYYYDKFIMFPTDGRERRCKTLGEKKNELKENKLCENYINLKNTNYDDKIERCKVVNDISDWRLRINRIPTDIIDGEKGCGFCFDNKQVMYGDSNGPFVNVGKKVCNNWIKPGKFGKGGSDKNKNVFASYPNPIQKFTDMFRRKINKGVKYDTQKMYEQELCKSIANCGQTNKYLKEDGTPLCGWCLMGRKGDGKGEGMVIKGGDWYTSSEPKYDDDYCPWPREIKKNSDGTFEKTRFYKTFNTRELKIWSLYKKIALIEKDSNKAMRLIKQYKNQNKLEELEESYKKKIPDEWDWYNKYGGGSINSKLLKDSGECEVVEELFPCFKNFSTGPHSDDCYKDMWNYMAKAPHGCDGNIFARVKPNLPHIKTFKEWQRGYIPSVENAIENIPTRAKNSRQYPSTYTSNTYNHPSENLLSAMLNSLACFGKKPDACDDKYRSRQFKYPRPKECTDKILANLQLPTTDPKYNPNDSSTFQYYWPLVNDSSWKEGIHYDWSNEKFKQKLEEKKNIFSNKDKIYKNQFSYNYRSARLHPYDNILLSSYYLYGKVREDLNLIYWQDHDGGMDKLWVKMCYEDFRDALKENWAASDPNFITLKDKIDLRNYLLLKRKVLDKGYLFTYKSVSGIDIKIELDNDRYITKQLYEHKFFPFWRLLPTKYYITRLYKLLQLQENKDRKRASCEMYKDTSECNNHKNCTFWGGKCRPKLLITEEKLNYSLASKQCYKKYGGRLAKTNDDNEDYVLDFAKNNLGIHSAYEIKTPKYLGDGPATPLNECEGDCDFDSDCKGNLICYHRQDSNTHNEAVIPGCKTVKKDDIAGTHTASMKPHGDFCVDPEKTQIVQKYVRKWPNCSNITCHNNIKLGDMKQKCINNGECDGFSWRSGINFGFGVYLPTNEENQDVGSGCLKKMCNVETESRAGYGHGSHGYWIKTTKSPPSFENNAWVFSKKLYNGIKLIEPDLWTLNFHSKKAICQLDYDTP